MTNRELARLYSDHARRDRSGLTMYGVLRRILEKAWCRETASPSCQAAWTEANPEFGQCAVTALVVQDLCGGTLVRCVMEGFGSHYFNHLPNGEDYAVYDLTRTQFPSGTTVPQGTHVERDYVLDSPRAVEAGTRQRYELLKERVAAAIAAAD